MRVKIIGFKVMEPYPTFNRTVDTSDVEGTTSEPAKLGDALLKALYKSDFISIRKVK